MAVTDEQWAAVAADQNMTVAELHAEIARIDETSPRTFLEPHFDLPHSEYDRDGDPLTLGQWSVLYSAPSYKFICRSVLPNRYWIATIWQGINYDFDDPPIVMETGAFLLLDPDRTELPEPSYIERHTTLQEALDGHQRIVDMCAGNIVPSQI